MHAQRIELEDGGWAGRFVHLPPGMRGCCGPWFLILKVHLSLLLKEEPPNVGAWTPEGSCGQSLKSSCTCPTLTPAQMKLLGKSSHRIGWLHFRFLVSDCKWAINTTSPPVGLLCFTLIQVLCLFLPPPAHSPSQLLLLTEAACLVGKIETNRWKLPPFATIKCTHLPTSSSATPFSFFSYTGASVSTPSKGKSLSPWSVSYSFLLIPENHIFSLSLSLLPQQIFTPPWIIAINL